MFRFHKFYVYRVSEKMLKLSINQLPSIEKRLLDIGRTNDADYIHKMRGGLRYTLNGLMERSFYVDQYPEFSAIVSMLPEDGDQKDSPVLFLKRIVDCYATSGDKLLKLLLEIKDIQWNKFFLICSSTVFLKELESLTDLKPVNLKIHTHPVFEAKVDDIPKFELPQGYYLSSLNDLDAVEINNSWTYASEGTEAFIRWLIKNFTTLAVRTGDSSLVAYMLPQGNGSLGMLNVYPDHRRRGLGQLVVSELVHKVKKPGETVYVHTNNNISIRLHEKCGFKKIIDSLWLEITPK